MVGRHAEQQILVTAYYSDGSSRDVTHEAQFKSNEIGIATVDSNGLVRTEENTGETAVMARYMGQVDVCRLSIPMADAVGDGPFRPSTTTSTSSSRRSGRSSS